MNDFPKWTGQVALISGAGSELGIGFAIARRLAREGVRLLITASSERIRQRAEELSACGHDVRAASADLTDEAQVQGLLDWAEAQWGRVDILVNNAGMAQLDSAEPFSAVEATSLRDWQLSLSRNLTSAFLLTRGLLPGMRERGYGRIVNVASTTGTRGCLPRLARSQLRQRRTAGGGRRQLPDRKQTELNMRNCNLTLSQLPAPPATRS